MAPDVIELMRRFLQHVLPTGFMKVRYFGFMNPNCKVDLETIRALIELSHGFTVAQPELQLEPRQPMACPHCGGALNLRGIVLRARDLDQARLISTVPLKGPLKVKLIFPMKPSVHGAHYGCANLRHLQTKTLDVGRLG